QAISTTSGNGLARGARRARVGELRARAVPALADHRHERGARDLAARDHRRRSGRRPVRAALRKLGGDCRADSLRRPVARRGAAGRLRARHASDRGALANAALPRHPPDRGPRRRAEGDGERTAPPPAARHLRAARRRRDLRLARGARRAAAPRRRPRDLGVLRRAGTAGVVDRRGARRAGGDRRGAAGVAGERSDPLTLLRALGVARRYGTITALAPTDFELAEGESVALVGPNGAGKSTLLAILAGALEPSEGTVERCEGLRVGWVPQQPAHYGRLTARENLELFARLEGERRPRAAAYRLL